MPQGGEIRTAGGSVRHDRLDKMLCRSRFVSGLIFDDVLFVSNPGTNCFVLNTGEGLVIIDAILPCVEAYEAIREGIASAGWGGESVKKLVLTHGHFDHCGAGRWIVEAWHPRTYLSCRDEKFWAENPALPHLEWTLKDFDITDYIDDGDVLSLGNLNLRVFSTPGHTPGGLSFIFDVYDRGEKHTAALWGGSNPMPEIEHIVQYMRSFDRFCLICEEYGVDVELTNHPFINDALEKVRLIKTGCRPNPFILGRHGWRRTMTKYREFCYSRLLAAGGG